MRANLASGFVLLIALVAGCAHQSPVGPDQARVLLQKRDVSYSQHSFLAAGRRRGFGNRPAFYSSGHGCQCPKPQQQLRHGPDAGYRRRPLEGGAVPCIIRGRTSTPRMDSASATWWMRFALKIPPSAMSKTPSQLRGDPCRRKTSAYWAGQPHQGRLDVVRFLVKKGTRINPPTRMGGTRGSGTTSLMLASAQGHVGVVRFLLDKGADIHVRRGCSIHQRGVCMDQVWGQRPFGGC